MKNKKNENLIVLEENSKWFIWLTNEAGINENGLHYSVYHDFGGGSLIHREALSPSQEHSVPWLRKLAREKIKENKILTIVNLR